MKSKWVNGLSDTQKGDMEGTYKAAAQLRERLRELLKDMEEDQLKYGRAKERYSEPNWELLQADTCGFNRALNQIISLIE